MKSRRKFVIGWFSAIAGLFATKLFPEKRKGKKEIMSTKAPAAIGPYSQGIQAGSFLFLSGQIPIDPSTGKLIQGGIEKQAKVVLKNIKSVLQAAGASMDDVVKATVYLSDLNNYSRVNKIYSSYFRAPYPARAAIEVSRLPKDVDIEIEVIARIE